MDGWLSARASIMGENTIERSRNIGSNAILKKEKRMHEKKVNM